MTDFKAVKGSSTSEERSQVLEPSFLLILAGFGAAIIVTASTLCIFITFRRQVLVVIILGEAWVSKVI